MYAAPLRARADVPALEGARKFLATGQPRAAEAAYDEALEAAADSIEARLGRAYARAFQRDFARAQADFREVLATDADNVGALSGLGYALAWAGAYPEAERQFRHALAVAPGQSDAAKGLAYVALWRGDAAEATRRFERSRPRRRRAPRCRWASANRFSLPAGTAKPAMHSRGRWRSSPAVPTRSGLERARASSVRFDATVLGGLTELGGSSAAGPRFAEIAVSPSDRVRMWLQLDDSLSLDNAVLARRELHVPTYYAGGLARWGNNYTTRLEGSWRKLSGGVL